MIHTPPSRLPLPSEHCSRGSHVPIAITAATRYIRAVLLSIIAAASENNVIGKNGAIPWHLPAEFAYLRETTTGKPAIMGRKTYDSIAALGRAPLPGRHNIVVTRNPDLHFEGADVVMSIDNAIDLAKSDGAEEAFIFGGQTLYEEALAQADRLYLTRVHTTVENGDAFFPAFDASQWDLLKSQRHEADAKNAHAFTTMVYERKN